MGSISSDLDDEIRVIFILASFEEEKFDELLKALSRKRRKIAINNVCRCFKFFKVNNCYFIENLISAKEENEKIFTETTRRKLDALILRTE